MKTGCFISNPSFPDFAASPYWSGRRLRGILPAMSHATFRLCDLLCCAMLAAAGLGPLAAQEKAHLALPSDFQSYVEPGFPFLFQTFDARGLGKKWPGDNLVPVSYTHLRAHETVLDLVSRLLLEKKKA